MKNTTNYKPCDKIPQELLEELEARQFYGKNLGNQNIIIIDDDMDHNHLVAKFLYSIKGSNNFVCNLFDDEVNAVKFILEEQVDLAIIDLNLTSISGKKIGNAIKNLVNYNIPIIYISADKQEILNIINNDADGAYCLTKPLSKSSLDSLITKITHAA